MLSAGAGAAVYAGLELTPVPAVVGATPPASAYTVVDVGLLVLAIGLAERDRPARRVARALPLADPLLPRRRPARVRAHARLRRDGRRRPGRLRAAAGDGDVLDAPVRRAHQGGRRRGARGRTRSSASPTTSSTRETAISRRCCSSRAGSRRAPTTAASSSPTRTSLAARHRRRVAVQDADPPTGARAGRPRQRWSASSTSSSATRWTRRGGRRLREAIVPQLATALESADLVDHVRRTHIATIAALSKSMEAKDFYTGGHTERVASSRSRWPGGSASTAPSWRRSRSARSCTTSARSGSPSASSRSPARSTTKSGRS